MNCRTPLCTGIPKPEWTLCPACADKVIENALRGPVARPVLEPEWVRRMRTRGLPAKDLTNA